MKYGILTHKKVNNTHKLYLEVDTSNYEFLIETSFIASDSFLSVDDVMFNDEPYDFIATPKIDNLFSVGSCVSCIIDMYNKMIIVSDIKKAAADSLIVFNNFSNNPTSSFSGQNGSSYTLFSKSISIMDDKKAFSDVLVGGCIILEDIMTEDGNAPLTMTITIHITGYDDYYYNLDLTRKHEILNFDHTFKNVKTNTPIDISVTYTYNTYKYGSSYYSPTLRNNNVTIYIQGTNIVTAPITDLYTFTIRKYTNGYKKYAAVTGIKDQYLMAYRIPEVYVDPKTREEIPVYEFSASITLPNCKYLNLGQNMKYINVNSVSISEDNNFQLYGSRSINSQYADYANNKLSLILPDSGIEYIYGRDGSGSYSGGFFSNAKEITIVGNPEKILSVYYYLPFGSVLPYKQYPKYTIKDAYYYYATSSNSYYWYAKSNDINIEADYVGTLYYASDVYGSYNYIGINALNYPDDYPNTNFYSSSNKSTINIKCKVFNPHYMIYIWRFGGYSAYEKDDYDAFYEFAESHNLKVRVYEKSVTFNIEGDVDGFGYTNYNDHYFRWNTNSSSSCTNINKHDIIEGAKLQQSSDGSFSLYNPKPSNYPYTSSDSEIMSYTSSGGSYSGTVEGEPATILSLVNINIKGDLYSTLYESYSNITFNIHIDGNMHSGPYSYSSAKYFYNSPFSSYFSYYYYYSRRVYGDSYTITGTYDMSKRIIYRHIKSITQKNTFAYSDAGEYIQSSYDRFREVTLSDNPFDMPNFSLSNFITTKMYGIIKFHVHKLAGIVSLPMFNTYGSNTMYFPGETNYTYFYYDPAADLKFDEIEPNTIITNFGYQSMKKLNIDFSKLAAIGDLSYCSVTRIELPTPIVAFLCPCSLSNNCYRAYNYKYSNGTNYSYRYGGSTKEDLSYDDDIWNDGNNNEYQYNLYIEYNAVCLGNILLKWEKMSDEEIENSDYLKFKYSSEFYTDEEIQELQDEFDSLDEAEAREILNSYSTYFNYKKADYDLYKLVLPKNENISKKINDFEFDKSSSFNMSGSYRIAADGEIDIYPKIKLFDVTRFIGSDFLSGYYYSVQQSGDIITLPKNLEFYGTNTFKYAFVDKDADDTVRTCTVSYDNTHGHYFNGYVENEDGTYSYSSYITDPSNLAIYKGCPIKEVKIGKYLESMVGCIFIYADRVTIDPENPNFVIKDNYIYNKDETILFRPVCYSEQKTFDPSDEISIISDTLTTIVDNRSFKDDPRIREINITSKEFKIYSPYDGVNESIINLPENITRLTLPTGDYTIIDSDFDKLEYVEFLNITATSKYYNIPGSDAGDIYTNYKKSIKYNRSYPQSMYAPETATVYGTKLIYAKNKSRVKIPDSCSDIGGKIHIESVVISGTRTKGFNISNPNVKIDKYEIEEGGNDVFFTTENINGESILWKRPSRTSTSKTLYKFPTNVSEAEVEIVADGNTSIDSIAFKYCDIKSINIKYSGSDRTQLFTCNGGFTEIPYAFMNEYSKQVFYEDEEVYNYVNYGLNWGSTGYAGYDVRNKSNFYFPQTHYINVSHAYNIVNFPVTNNVLEELHISGNPQMLFGTKGNFGDMMAVSVPVRPIDYWVGDRNYSYTGSAEYMLYKNDFVQTLFTCPSINKLYIDYLFGNTLNLYFPIDNRYKEVHFSEKSVSGLQYISRMIVCGKDTKIYPENMLEDITNHNYELYYNTNTNLTLNETTFESKTFGEKSGAPFKSDSTITLKSCFVHSLFIHPNKCENIDLVLSDDTRFGYCTEIITQSRLVGDFNIFNQYSDYIRTFSSSSYTTGNDGRLGYYFFLFSPALSATKYVETQFRVLHSITTPRLIGYLFRGDITSDDKYKLNGSWVTITMPIQYIPYHCFDVTRTDEVAGSGYTLFTYEEFSEIVKTLKGVDVGNKFLVPTNPDGETVYSLRSDFDNWRGCTTSSIQQYIDRLEINSNMTEHFIDKNSLLLFVKNLVFNNKNVKLYLYTNSMYQCDYFDNTVVNNIHINHTSPTIDIGRGKCNSTSAMSSNYASTTEQNKYNLIFGDNITEVSIYQLQFMPYQYNYEACLVDELDFTKFPDITFTFGFPDNLTYTNDASWDFAIRSPRISGFNRVVLGDNVKILDGFAKCLFAYFFVKEIVFNGSDVIAVYYPYLETHITFGENIKDISSLFYGYSATSPKIIIDNFSNIESVNNWNGDSVHSNIKNHYAEYCFYATDFTNVTFDSLVTVHNKGGFSNCKFNDTVELPVLTYAGERAFYTSSSNFISLIAPVVETIEAEAFYNCKLEQISIPKAKFIGLSAFYGCPIKGDDGVLTLDSAEEIHESAFNSSSITELHIPKAKLIKARAFYSCQNIVKVFLPEDCEVEAAAFFNTTILIRE